MKPTILTIILLIISGCGGGTSGTGSILVEGRVLNSDGSALRDATVSILQSGDSTTTDQNGDFVIQTTPSTENSLLIERDSLNVVVEIGSTSDGSNRIKVSIEVEVESNSGSLISIETLDREEEDDDSSSSSSGDDRVEIKVCGTLQSISVSQATINGMSYEFAPGTEFEDNAGNAISVNDFVVGELVELTIRNGSTHELEKDDDCGESDDDSPNDHSDDSDDNHDSDDSDDDDDERDDRDDDNSKDTTSSSENRERFCGTISSISGNSLVVGSTNITVSNGTEYEDASGNTVSLSFFMVGDFVQVDIRNGEVHEIELEDELSC